MKKEYRSYNGVERRYKSIRGDKKFRLPPGERSRSIDDTPQNRRSDQIDNNPGRRPQAPNPDDL